VKKGVIDRFEGDLAVIETDDRQIVHLPREKLPKEAKEGSVVEIREDRAVVLHRETEERRERIRDLMKGLFEDL